MNSNPKVYCRECGNDCSHAYTTWRGYAYHVLCLPDVSQLLPHRNLLTAKDYHELLKKVIRANGEEKGKYFFCHEDELELRELDILTGIMGEIERERQ